MTETKSQVAEVLVEPKPVLLVVRFGRKSVTVPLGLRLTENALEELRARHGPDAEMKLLKELAREAGAHLEGLMLPMLSSMMLG